MSQLRAQAQAADAPVVHETVVVRSWKTPLVLDVFAAIALILAFVAPRAGSVSFVIASATDLVRIPDVSVPAAALGGVLAGLLAIGAVAGHAFQFLSRSGRVPLGLIAAFALLFFVAFLAWAGAGERPIAVADLFVSALALSVPLIFGGLGGVISERVGVVNVAIEGQLLAGAFTAAVVASATHSAIAGILAAMVAGTLVSFVLAVFSIRYLVDQVIVGVVLNVLVTGLTNFLLTTVLVPNPGLNHTDRLDPIAIPLLSQIPVIGPALFRQSAIVYLMYLAVFLVWFGLFKTRWGLRLRAVGEHPTAADTVGINVTRTRFWNVSLAGAVAGLGGAYYTLDSLSSFDKVMTGGAGFIALAAVIFGRWDPLRTTLAALLFGFATSLRGSLAAIGSPVPSELLLALPYVITVLAVAGLVGHSRGPAASGKPYVKS